MCWFASFLQTIWSKCTSLSQPSNGGSPLRTTWRLCLHIILGSVDLILLCSFSNVCFIIVINSLKPVTMLHWSYCRVLSAVCEESPKNHGSTKPAGRKHGVRPELQCGLVPEEAQSAGMLTKMTGDLFLMFKRGSHHLFVAQSVNLPNNKRLRSSSDDIQYFSFSVL